MNDIKIGDFVRVKNIPGWLNITVQGLNVFKVEEIAAQMAIVSSIRNPNHTIVMFLSDLERINKFRPGDSVRYKKAYALPRSKRKIFKVNNIAYNIEREEVNVRVKGGFYSLESNFMLKKRGK